MRYIYYEGSRLFKLEDDKSIVEPLIKPGDEIEYRTNENTILLRAVKVHEDICIIHPCYLYDRSCGFNTRYCNHINFESVDENSLDYNKSIAIDDAIFKICNSDVCLYSVNCNRDFINKDTSCLIKYLFTNEI